MFVSLATGNRDPEVFAIPEEVDVGRETSVPNLTFGSGIHYCLGAHLARGELQEALAIIATRLPTLELAGEIEWKPENFRHLGTVPPARPLVGVPELGRRRRRHHARLAVERW